jgi:hypothetical protein
MIDHPKSHKVYDANTGKCIDCDVIVDPTAPLVTATIERATVVFLAAYGYALEEWGCSDTEAIEYALPHALCSAFNKQRKLTND